jgi:DNA-binding XRE family transcriptional regulator
MDALVEEFGTLIRWLRLEWAYSQEGLAEAAELERAYVGMVERGEVNVSVRTALKLSRLWGPPWLGCSPSWSEGRKVPATGKPGETQVPSPRGKFGVVTPLPPRVARAHMRSRCNAPAT